MPERGYSSIVRAFPSETWRRHAGLPTKARSLDVQSRGQFRLIVNTITAFVAELVDNQPKLAGSPIRPVVDTFKIC
jgi:hypothetical protein